MQNRIRPSLSILEVENGLFRYQTRSELLNNPLYAYRGCHCCVCIVKGGGGMKSKAPLTPAGVEQELP